MNSGQLANADESARLGWRRLAGVVLAGFCVFMPFYAVQPLLVMFRERFNASAGAVSLTVSATAIAVALASPVVGVMADRIGRKRVIVPSLLLVGVATLLCAISKTLGELLCWRFVCGLLSPGVIAVTVAYISEESPADGAGRVTAAYVTGTVAGGLVGRVGAAAIADHFNWPWAFVALGFATIIGAIAVGILLPGARRFERHGSWGQMAAAMGRHLRNGRLLATYLAGFNALFCHVGLFTYVGFHLAGPPFGLSTSALGLVFLVYALGVVVTPTSGRLIDRYGSRAGAMVAASAIIVGDLTTLFPAVWSVILGLSIASTGVFIAQAVASSHVGKVAGEARSAAMGLYVACYYLGGSAGAAGLAVAWRWGGWPAVVAVLVAVAVTTAAVAWRFYLHGGEAAVGEVVVDG